MKDVLLGCMEKGMKMTPTDRMLIHFKNMYGQGTNVGAHRLTVGKMLRGDIKAF